MALTYSITDNLSAFDVYIIPKTRLNVNGLNSIKIEVCKNTHTLQKTKKFSYQIIHSCYYEKTGSEVKNITDEIDFDLPNGWEYIRLSTVCWLDDTAKVTGETLPYLDAKTLRGKAELSYMNEGKVVSAGTKVILVDGENSGEVFDVPFRGYMGSTFKILGISPFFDVQYLNTILDFYKDTFRGSKIGAAIPHLNKNLFRSLLIRLPSLAEQKRIVAEIEKFEPLIRSVYKELHADRETGC